MQRPFRSIWLRYVGAILAVILAELVRLTLDPVLGSRYTFTLLYLPILLVAGSWGRGPALLATALGGFLSAYFMLPPRRSVWVESIDDQVGLLLYAVVGVGIAVLGGALREARRRAEGHAVEADRGRQQLRITLDSIRDAVVVTDSEGHVTALNPAAESLIGWPSPEAVGQPLPSLVRIVHEETRRPIDNPVLRSLRQGGDVAGALVNSSILIARDGSEHPIDESVSPILDSAGRIIGSVLVLRDIGERKRAEAEVRRAAEQARTILESITDGFCAFDRDWRYIYANRRAEILLGRTRQVMLGKSHWEVYPDTLGTELERNYRRAADENVAIVFEYFYAPHNCWYELHAYPSPEGLSVYFRDVTEPKRAAERERQLLEETATANAKFKAFFEQGPLFAGIMALDGTILEANRLCLEACGFSREEVIGRPFWECPWWSPSTTLAARVKAGSLQAAAGETFQAEMPYFVADGSERTVDLVILPIKDETGRVLFVAPTGTDITERKRAEEQLREQRELLRVTLASVSDAVITTDVEGRVTFLNVVAESLTGWQNDSALGRPLGEVFRVLHEETRQPVEDRATQVLREGETIGRANHSLLIARDGTERPIDESAAPIRDERGEVAGVVLIFRDVSARRAAERDLQRNEERLRLFVEHAPAAVAMLDREMRYLLVSSRWLADFELGETDLRGRSHYEVLPTMPEHWKAVHNRCLAGAVERAEEDSFLRPDGQEEWLRWEVRPWRDDRGEVGGIIIFSEIITKARRDRQIVQEQAETLSGILSATVDHIYVVDQAGRYRHVSAGGARVLGLESGEMIGKHWSELGLPAETMVPFDAQREQVLHAGQPARHEVRFHLPSGELSEFEYMIAPVAGEHFRPDEVVVISRNVTEHKVAERERLDLLKRLETQNAFTNAVLTQAPAAIIVADARTGRILMSNHEAHRIVQHEYAPGDVLNDDHEKTFVLDAFHADGSPYHPGEWPLERALGGETVVGEEIDLIRRDRSRLTIRANAGPVRVGEDLVAAVVAFHDITDRKADEQTARFLADASGMLSGLVDYESTLQKVAGMAVPTFADWAVVDMADTDGTARRLAVAHTDPSKVELAVALNRRYPPDPDAQYGSLNVLRTGRSEIVSDITDAMLEASANDEEHLRILRELGLRSYVSVPLSVRGETLGVLSFVSAESGRHYDEHDLAVAEDLASRAAIAIENARLYSELREADRRKDEFLATLAHELRNPLAPIRNTLHLMRQIDGKGPMEEDRAMAERQVVHLARLIDDLMDVARISRGKIDLHREIVGLATVVNQAVETARPQIDERRHHLTVSLPDEPIRLEGDPTRLEQILWNLLNNAAKYSDPGGEINLDVTRDGDDVVLQVRDTGIGIAPEMLPRVFEMFVQIGAHKGHAQGGLGIGLSLVRTLVELHGGSITVHSNGPGTGSTFTIRLPLLKEMPEGEASAPSRRRVSNITPPRRRILVVDDNSDAANSLARLLEKLYEQDVCVAHDGRQALALAAEFRPNIIVLDIGLPGMDGYEVARLLRKQPQFRDTLLVALTGWGQDSDLARSRAAGFNHHLVKPVNPDALVDLISKDGEREM